MRDKLAKRTTVLICTHRVLYGRLVGEALTRVGLFRSARWFTSLRDLFRAAPKRGSFVALLDPGIPREDVFAMTVRLHRKCPEGRVILIAEGAPVGWVYRAVQARVDGYLSACASLAEHLRAIHVAMQEQRYYSPCAGKIVTDLAARPTAVPSPCDQEMEVLRRISAGMSSKEIGCSLGLKTRNVDVIRARLMEKTHTRTATALVRYACSERFVDCIPPSLPRSEIDLRVDWREERHAAFNGCRRRGKPRHRRRR